MDMNLIANIIVAITAIGGLFFTYKQLTKEKANEKNQTIIWRTNIENSINDINDDIEILKNTVVEMNRQFNGVNENILLLQQNNINAKDLDIEMKSSIKELVNFIAEISKINAKQGTEIFQLQKDVTKLETKLDNKMDKKNVS